VPRKVVARLYRAADVCIVPLRDLSMFRKVLPSKIFEILGVGTPIICSVPGEAGDLVQRSGGGIVSRPRTLMPWWARSRSSGRIRIAAGEWETAAGSSC